MLSDRSVMATIAVKDIEAAKAFYGGTLGLECVSAEADMLAVYRSGSASLLVYVSEFAGTNKATSATWGLGGEFDTVVAALKRAGVTFEHYDMPGGTREGDVHVFGDFRAAWFRDPDGNILHINNH